MKIVVLGGGLAGCTVGHLLKEKGYEVVLVEKNQDVGGICQSYEVGGIYYEFGPHVLYAKKDTKSYEFFRKHMPEVNEQKYFPRLSVDGKVKNLCAFPPTVENVLRLSKEDREKAIEELYHVNLDKTDLDNLESFIISRVGKTMYEYFFHNYNKKHWGIEPKDMDTEWARFRNFFLRSKDYGMFGDAWQGHPMSYRNFFEKLTQGIQVKKGEVTKIVYEEGKVINIEIDGVREEGDLYISTLPIDYLIGKENELAYRGVTKIFFHLKGKSGLPTYLCTFPNNYSFTRLIDYGKQSGQECEDSLISFAFPHGATECELPIEQWKEEAMKFITENLAKEVLDVKVINQNYCYPVSTAPMLTKFDSILKKVSEIQNLITFGRLGLYSYISMCTIVEQSFNVAENMEVLREMDQKARYEFYLRLRKELV